LKITARIKKKCPIPAKGHNEPHFRAGEVHWKFNAFFYGVDVV